MKYSSPLSLRLDEDLRKQVEEMAEEEERPVGMMARILLREALEARKKEMDEIMKRDAIWEPAIKRWDRKTKKR